VVLIDELIRAILRVGLGSAAVNAVLTAASSELFVSQQYVRNTTFACAHRHRHVRFIQNKSRAATSTKSAGLLASTEPRTVTVGRLQGDAGGARPWLLYALCCVL